ncbi:hypothetical protein [Streptomyces cyaneochromogenes]|nr:hypothetical protein [Streptomyces cyaneochromogenes]
MLRAARDDVAQVVTESYAVTLLAIELQGGRSGVAVHYGATI